MAPDRRVSFLYTKFPLKSKRGEQNVLLSPFLFQPYVTFFDLGLFQFHYIKTAWAVQALFKFSAKEVFHLGRRAKPIDLLVLDGKKNLTKKEIEARKEAEKKIQPEASKVRPPTWLSKEAKKEFRRIAKELLEVDLITNVDVDALAMYCDAYVDYIECTRIIEEEGLLVEYTNKAAETNKVPHPLLTKKKQLYDQMKTLTTEFGLSPSARAKIAIPKQEKKEPTEFQKKFGDV